MKIYKQEIFLTNLKKKKKKKKEYIQVMDVSNYYKYSSNYKLVQHLKIIYLISEVNMDYLS